MHNDNDDKTIMMVEPDVVIRMVIAEHLRDCGYRVIEGVAAQDVWDVLESGRRIQILLVDVALAGEADGFSLARRIRQTRSDIDVILTSGISSAAQESHDLCEEGPVKKPYEPKDIEARIRILTERRRASNKP
jgi:DNA-binding response OmpR family regulator